MRQSKKAAGGIAKLEGLAKRALDVAKTARKHGKSLVGDNYYGHKLAELRTEAVAAFEKLYGPSSPERGALSSPIDAVFSPSIEVAQRLAATRDLTHNLRILANKQGTSSSTSLEVFPSTILAQAKRQYIASIGRQMNGSYAEGWLDACAVMMRRLLEIAIIEAFENHGIAAKIKDNSGDYLQLSALIDRALAEPAFKLSRNTKKSLPALRDVGHRSAHGRYFNAQPGDIERIQPGCRDVLEEFLHHGGLL